MWKKKKKVTSDLPGHYERETSKILEIEHSNDERKFQGNLKTVECN